MSDEIHRALGRIEGELSGIKRTQSLHTKKIDHINGRLSANEAKAATNGAITGGIVTAGILLIKELMRNHGI